MPGVRNVSIDPHARRHVARIRSGADASFLCRHEYQSAFMKRLVKACDWSHNNIGPRGNPCWHKEVALHCHRGGLGRYPWAVLDFAAFTWPGRVPFGGVAKPAEVLRYRLQVRSCCGKPLPEIVVQQYTYRRPKAILAPVLQRRERFRAILGGIAERHSLRLAQPRNGTGDALQVAVIPFAGDQIPQAMLDALARVHRAFVRRLKREFGSIGPVEVPA